MLAAGSSSRLGRPKQLLPYMGQPLLRAVASEACASRCAPVGVVVRVDDAAARAALAGLSVTFITNTDSAEGIASSIRAAVAWAAHDEQCDGVVLLACDQPALRSEHVDALVARAAADALAHTRAHAVASHYADIIGIPAFFPRSLFRALAALRGASGARELLRAEPTVLIVDWPEGAFDVDTPQDAARLPG